MATKADTETSTTASNPVVLPANSYDVQELQKRLDSAAALKTDEGRANSISKTLLETAKLPDVLTEQAKPALPPGHTLEEVANAQGDIVTAPVAKPAEEGEAAADEPKPDDGAQTAAAKGGAKAQPTTPAAD